MSESLDRAAAKEVMRHDFVAAAAKLGFTMPNRFRPTAAELHEDRKTLRRLVNELHDSVKPGEQMDPQTANAFTFAADQIAQITGKLEHMHEYARSGPETGQRAMRTEAEFRAHYDRLRGDDAEAAEPIGLADFFRAVAGQRTTDVAKRALAVGTDSAGGYTVPAILMPGVLAALVPVSSLLTAGAGIIPVDLGGKTFSQAVVNTIPSAAWRAEAGALATSDPAFRTVTATPHSLAFQFKVSRELLADGNGLDQALYQVVAQAFARELDRAGLRGSGSAPEPRGILNTAGIQSVGNGTNGSSLASYANLLSAVQGILQADAPTPGAAIMSPRSLVKLGGLADTTNQPLRVPPMLEGLKLIATSQIPNNLTVGTSSDCTEIYVGDFRQVNFVMREQPSVFLARDLYAGTGEIGFMCHVRADVVVNYPAALAVVTGVRA